MERADRIIDLGPGAASASGVRGTFVVPERAVEDADDPKVLARRERQRGPLEAAGSSGVDSGG